MQQLADHFTKQEELEPLFIKFVNFQFKHQPLEDFFTMLNRAGIEIPLEELFLYYRTEDKEYTNGPQFLTEVEKEKISKDLESDRQEFKKALLNVINKRKFGTGLEKINLHCAEIPLQFTYHKKDSGKLDLAVPSVESIGEVGWANFILGLVAVDLGKYLMNKPATKIRSCKKKDCRKFFTLRGGKAVFCSNDCKRLFHYLPRRDSGYYRKKMKEGRSKGKYQ